MFSSNVGEWQVLIVISSFLFYLVINVGNRQLIPLGWIPVVGMSDFYLLKAPRWSFIDFRLWLEPNENLNVGSLSLFRKSLTYA